jgi:hypothetical protein
VIVLLWFRCQNKTVRERALFFGGHRTELRQHQPDQSERALGVFLAIGVIAHHRLHQLQLEQGFRPS